MIVACSAFFLVTATTFTSLGYILFTMAEDLGWSRTAAGMSFSLLGLACGLSSPLPAIMMKRFGTCITMVSGSLVLATGFLAAALTPGLILFFFATTLMGAGFSLLAPAPGVFLMANWFGDRAPRMIGVYFMAGSFGGVIGPLLVGAIVALSGSWRLHWAIMAALALILALACALGIRDQQDDTGTPAPTRQQSPDNAATPASADANGWTVKAALRSRAFIILALTMAAMQTVYTTLHSILVMHMASFTTGSTAGAIALSTLALSGTISKGISGGLAEKFNAQWLMVAGLILQAASMATLAAATAPIWAYLGAVLAGLGWGAAWLSANTLLLRYFGKSIIGDLVAMATMATTIAVVGPVSAGWVADTTGSYRPILTGFAALLGLIALATLWLNRSARSDAKRQKQQHIATQSAS
nr:MFS transporter [Altericroceibacterium endophyticum]